MSADASIMMVTYNRIELTKRTLECIANLDREFNLIIVDNGSTDETDTYLSCLAENYKPKNLKDLIIHYNKKNKGIAVGRNQALKLADEIGTEWMCTLDNDVLVPSSFLSECIDILKANNDYGAIGVNFESTNYPLVTQNGKTFQRKSRGNLGTACMTLPKSTHKILGFFNL